MPKIAVVKEAHQLPRKRGVTDNPSCFSNDIITSVTVSISAPCIGCNCVGYTSHLGAARAFPHEKVHFGNKFYYSMLLCKYEHKMTARKYELTVVIVVFSKRIWPTVFVK